MISKLFTYMMATFLEKQDHSNNVIMFCLFGVGPKLIVKNDVKDQRRLQTLWQRH